MMIQRKRYDKVQMCKVFTHSQILLSHRQKTALVGSVWFCMTDHVVYGLTWVHLELSYVDEGLAPRTVTLLLEPLLAGRLILDVQKCNTCICNMLKPNKMADILQTAFLPLSPNWARGVLSSSGGRAGVATAPLPLSRAQLLSDRGQTW